MEYTLRYDSPLGPLTLVSDGEALTGLRFAEPGSAEEHAVPGTEKRPPLLSEAVRWLNAYFSGRDPGFTPVLRPQGSPFRMAVWEILRTIPYGQTVTYGQIAAVMVRKTGKRRMSAQAVGGAVGHNPIALIIPCHRVIGADGSLTGYAGGLDRKRGLLELEGIRIRETQGRKKQDP